MSVVIHFSDTHLGKGGYNKIDPDTGENLRERQIYQNFLDTCDTIIGEHPDLVIHSGDLFDTVKPKNKALVVAAEGIRRFEESEVPLLMITGNHDMVKTRHTASPFHILEYTAKKTVLVHEFKERSLVIGDIKVHLIPNMPHPDEYVASWQRLQFDSNLPNYVVMHGLAPGIKNKRLNTTAEMDIPDEILQDERISYVALGHYHNQEEIGDRIWYSGSLEYLTYGEIFDTKGALEVTDSSVEQMTDLPKTPMMYFKPIECQDLTPAEITDAICKKAEKGETDGMGQITLKNIGAEKSSALDYVKIAEVSQHMLHLKLKRDDEVTERPQITEGETIHSIDYTDEFQKYVGSLGLSQRERELVSTRGTDILKESLARRVA